MYIAISAGQKLKLFIDLFFDLMFAWTSVIYNDVLLFVISAERSDEISTMASNSSEEEVQVKDEARDKGKK